MTTTPNQFSPDDTPMPGMDYMPPQNPYDLRIGFGKRFGAWFIDLVITLAFGGILFMIAGTALVSMFGSTMEAMTTAQGVDEATGGFMEVIGTFAIAVTLVAVLYGLVELFTGASPGKHILGIIAAHDNRKQGNISLYATRWAVKNSSTLLSFMAMVTGVHMLSTLSSLVGFIIFIGFFFMFSEKKQALHDIIAKTAIYNKEDVLAADSM